MLYVSNPLLLLCFSGTLELRGTGGNSAVLTANTGNKWGGIRFVNSNGTLIVQLRYTKLVPVFVCVTLACVRVCVCACMCACVRAYLRVCVHVCIRCEACVRGARLRAYI